MAPQPSITVFLAGDVMTGRGMDQILPHPGGPRLREAYLRDARGYVDLAEAKNGKIPIPVDFSWPWGDALDVLAAVAPDVRVVNLETSITSSDAYAPGKGIHYRMHPDNAGCLTAARLDGCTLANNHVLDFGVRGLEETIESLRRMSIRPIGAGDDLAQSQSPAVFPVPGRGRVIVFALGTPSSGVPSHWAATPGRAGVDYLADLSDASLSGIAKRIRDTKRPGDVVVVSIHWGSNWGYDVPRQQTRFAHRLIDSGADLIHGHSSHHPRPLECHRGKLVIYGCGDLINDYEGIGGYEGFRDDLRLLYFARLDPGTGECLGLRMAPMQARRMRLEAATARDTEWLAQLLDQVSRPRGARIESHPDRTLTLALD